MCIRYSGQCTLYRMHIFYLLHTRLDIVQCTLYINVQYYALLYTLYCIPCIPTPSITLNTSALLYFELTYAQCILYIV